MRFVDLDGDGLSDVLITEEHAFTCYPSEGEGGFGPPERVRKAVDEEEGPTLVLADGTQSIYLADCSGDGLTDLVRIRNGEVCYWPNLGYGRFGVKVTMGNSPFFDRPDLFDQSRIRLADVDGSGTTDVLYLKGNAVDIWFNESGNSWSDRRRLESLPTIDDMTRVSVIDLLGEGTACIVWSSPLPGDVTQATYYIDLMGGEKPHPLRSMENNLGAKTILQYAPSTQFYLEDRTAGKPWITRLPFPVQVVESVEVVDHISQTRYITRYRYHHGYFDGPEREFRGFAMVEQWDTDAFPRFAEHDPFPDSPHGTEEEHHLPPVHTKTWFHTGAYREGQKISHHLAHEYYGAPSKDDPDYESAWKAFEDRLLPDTDFPRIRN